MMPRRIMASASPRVSRATRQRPARKGGGGDTNRSAVLMIVMLMTKVLRNADFPASMKNRSDGHGGEAAIDGDDRAGHKGRCVGGEPQDRALEFLGLAEAGHRSVAENLRLSIL